MYKYISKIISNKHNNKYKIIKKIKYKIHKNYYYYKNKNNINKIMFNKYKLKFKILK